MPVVDEAADVESALVSATATDRAGKISGGDGDAEEAKSDDDGELPVLTLARLKKEADNMKRAKKDLMKQLRNAKRRNQRLKSKARKLTDADLLAIVAMRQAGKPDGRIPAARHGGGNSSPSMSSTGAGSVEPPGGEGVVARDTGEAALDAADLEAGVDRRRLAERMAL